MAVLWSWDGERLTERELTAGLHIVVNSGLDSELRAAEESGSGSARQQAGGRSAGHEHERERLAHFLPRLRAAVRPVPRPGTAVSQAWGAWLPLLTGDGIGTDDPRALIVAHDLDARRDLGNDVDIAGSAGARRAAV